MLLGDGMVELEVTDLFPDYALLTVINGGEIRSNQTVHVKDKSFKMPFLSEKDKKGILYGIKKSCHSGTNNFFPTQHRYSVVKIVL